MNAPEESNLPAPPAAPAAGSSPVTPSALATDPGVVASGTKPASPLTPEEQMALFEQDLKENDWGHQPC